MIRETAAEKLEYEYLNEFDKQFDEDFQELFTSRLKENEGFGRELWSALANVTWYHKDDPYQTECHRSFRSAGSLIAVMEGIDTYTKWYCSGPYETVSDYIAQALAERGWYYELDGDEPGP